MGGQGTLGELLKIVKAVSAFVFVSSYLQSSLLCLENNDWILILGSDFAHTAKQVKFYLCVCANILFQCYYCLQ